MKNLFIALLVIVVAGFAPINAAGTGGNPKAEKEFEKRFGGAENVKWSQLSEGYLKVSFTLNGTRVESFFDDNAELIGTVRNIFYNQLPLPVIQSLSNHFTGAVITEITEISTAEDVINYIVMLEKGDKKFKLRLSSQGGVLGQQKVKLKK